MTLLACVAPTAATGEERLGRAFCRPLDYETLTRPVEESPGQPRPLRVPVAIHIMDRPGKQAARAFWAASKTPPAPHAPGTGGGAVPASGLQPEGGPKPAQDLVERYFSPCSALSVNDIWAAAGIRFEVAVVEHCTYALPATDCSGQSVVAPDASRLRATRPACQQETIERYLAISAHYGIPRMVNVYLWDLIVDPGGVDILGYGESPRRDRPEVSERNLAPVPVAWVTSAMQCTSDSGKLECQQNVAHELGHALGLRHSCHPCRRMDSIDCCAPLCWVPRAPSGDYYGHASPVGGSCAGVVLPARPDCCCGCEPQDAVRDGLDVSGEPVECCGSEAAPSCEGMRAGERLMHPEALGRRLCRGEIHSARSAVREFFQGLKGGFR